MYSLNTSTQAALEEMLQNTARPPPADFLPVYFNHSVIGCLNPEFIPYLQETLGQDPIDLIVLDPQRLFISQARPIEVSQSLQALTERLRAGGFIPGWRNEEFAWLDVEGHEHFRLERAAFKTFGFRSLAAHINGYTKNGLIWLGRRSESKSIDPGRLDNLSAGGISADETPWVCAKRELWEEAGVPIHLAQAIQPAGRIPMRRVSPPLGFHDELLFVYDLELPDHFVPTNHDGEVSGFIEVSYAEAAARILADEFTADASLVTADFILRHSKLK
ncbi:nudix hydrolase [Burkholderiaceae bacterium]|jgi:8-oxo-dGTP pyrophosphatase MutT (NUDIX family)